MGRLLMPLCTTIRKAPAPGVISWLVSHLMRNAPLSMSNESVCMSPCPDHDSMNRHPIVSGLASGFVFRPHPAPSSARITKAAAFRRGARSPLCRNPVHRFPKKLDMLVQRLFENPLLVAVRSVPFRRIFFVHHRPHAVALHPFSS